MMCSEGRRCRSRPRASLAKVLYGEGSLKDMCVRWPFDVCEEVRRCCQLVGRLRARSKLQVRKLSHQSYLVTDPSASQGGSVRFLIDTDGQAQHGAWNSERRATGLQRVGKDGSPSIKSIMQICDEDKVPADDCNSCGIEFLGKVYTTTNERLAMLTNYHVAHTSQQPAKHRVWLRSTRRELLGKEEEEKDELNFLMFLSAKDAISFVRRFKKWQRDQDRERRRKAGGGDSIEQMEDTAGAHPNLTDISNVSGGHTIHTMEDIMNLIQRKHKEEQQELYRREPKPRVSPISLREACSYIFGHDMQPSPAKSKLQIATSANGSGVTVNKIESLGSGTLESTTALDEGGVMAHGSAKEHFMLIPDAR